MFRHIIRFGNTVFISKGNTIISQPKTYQIRKEKKCDILLKISRYRKCSILFVMEEVLECVKNNITAICRKNC